MVDTKPSATGTGPVAAASSLAKMGQTEKGPGPSDRACSPCRYSHPLTATCYIENCSTQAHSVRLQA